RLPLGIQVLNATNYKSLRKIEDLFEGYEWLFKICLYDCYELLKDKESLKVFVAYVETITLKLPPKWQTQIIGLAISDVFNPRHLYNELGMELRFVNDGMYVPKPQINASSKSKKENLWIGYVPLSLLETMHDDGEDFQTKDWSHVIKGYLVIVKYANAKKPCSCWEL
nr:hypothetical protein [Tanacetum cinerariifolium]